MKVYLAKSNRANPTTVAEVRQMLGQFDCEVVEYTGGQYTNAPLLQSDLLLIVVEDLDTGIVGKGLAQQMADFQQTKRPILVVKNIGPRRLFVSKLATIRELDAYDYIAHSRVVLNENILNINEFIKEKQDITMLS